MHPLRLLQRACVALQKRVMQALYRIKSKKMANIYVFESNKITEEEFDIFLEQFARGEPTGSLTLSQRLKNEWWKFVDSRKTNEIVMNVELPYSKCLEKDPKEPGIYGIFGKHPNSIFPQCFYAGISVSDVRNRVSHHLTIDVKINYRNNYHWIKECSDIFLCYAPMLKSNNEKGLKLKLELLEHCLTVELRPWFIISCAIK